MGIMKYFDSLEEELLEKRILKLDKKDELTKQAKIWFSSTCEPENYSGIFENIKLDVTETPEYVIIRLDDDSYEKTVHNTMDGLEDSLKDLISLLKESKEGD